VDFRLISATNRPLDQFVRDERFREDLYYRINAFAIRLPSLRERPVDIPVLAQRFLARYCAAQGLPLDSKTFAREAVDALIAYPWPGNIRASLTARAQRCRRRDGDSRVRHRILHANIPSSGPGTAAIARRSRTRAHHPHSRAVHWNKKEAARVLAISVAPRKSRDRSRERSPKKLSRHLRSVSQATRPIANQISATPTLPQTSATPSSTPEARAPELDPD
jgi:DNA-binding NtrC family response regulator